MAKPEKKDERVGGGIAPKDQGKGYNFTVQQPPDITTMPRKTPENKVSKGRTPKPAVNNIKSVTKSEQLGRVKDLQKRLAAVRNKLPIGANANNAVFNRGKMMGPGSARGVGIQGALLHALTPVARKAGSSLGKHLGIALRPVGRAIDQVAGTKPKKKKP